MRGWRASETGMPNALEMAMELEGKLKAQSSELKAVGKDGMHF